MRGKGIGRALLDEVMSLHELTALKAETDKDAVGFYRTCGFRIESLGEIYPGLNVSCVLGSDWITSSVLRIVHPNN